MVSNQVTVTVRNVNVKNADKPLFCRVVNTGGDFDANVIFSAMRILFPGDMFKISIETYGA